MEHEAVAYDEPTMIAKAMVWTLLELCESYELGGAYHKVEMERMWPELNAIFGPDKARNPELKANLPPKLPRRFERIGLDGRPKPCIDEIIADYLDEEKRSFERKHGKGKRNNCQGDDFVPADCVSTTKGEGEELIPAKRNLILSPDLNQHRASSSGARGAVPTKQFLSF